MHYIRPSTVLMQGIEGLLVEVKILREALRRRTSQANSLALIASIHAHDSAYYRDRTKELEEELAVTLQADPVRLRTIAPFRFRD